MVAKKAAEASVKDNSTQQVIALPNDTSYKVLVILIHAHLVNLGQPGTYTEEVKKGLREANFSEIDVPNDVDSGAIFRVTLPSNNATMNQDTGTIP